MGIIAPPVNGYHVGVKFLPPAVRPRECLQARGASDLSDAELRAIIVRTGTPSCNALELSTRALACHGGLAGVDRAALDELSEDEGLGPNKAMAIKAAPELYRGNLAGTSVRLGELFRDAIRHNVASFISLKERGLGFAA
jgi:DNA repair protein RadC